MNIKKCTTATLLSLAAFAANAQTGAWSGSISVQGMKIQMVFHLDDGNATLDVPTQGAKDIPATLTRNDDGSIAVEVPSIGASYKGKLKDGAVEGMFMQHGYPFAMKLTQGEQQAARPQAPVPPFPYSTEEVTFCNGDATLSGTLTLPEGCDKNTPVAIMITGSGLQDRNSTMFAHQPFLVIADALARHGIATLRYDDRGFAKSTGDLINVTTQDLKNDALAGITLLRKRFKKVGVIGHSEGGTIAMMLAAERKADFIVSLAGAVLSGKDVLLAQNRTMLAAMNLPQKTIDEYCKALDKGFTALSDGKTLEEATNEAAGGKAAIGGNVSDPTLNANLKAAMQQMATPYGRYFLKLAGADYLDRISCPVLAINGTLDRQVDCKTNLEALRKGLNKNGKKHSNKNKIVEEDALNHLFQHCKTGAVTEYADIEETFSPDALNEIIAWIDNL